MANYNDIKNAALIAPTTTPDLGSENFRYGNVYLSGDVNIAGTSITSTNAVTPKIASLSYPTDDTAAAPLGAQSIIINGSGFVTGAGVYVGGSLVAVVTVNSGTSITFNSPAKAAGNYTLAVVNVDGGSATFMPGLQYSGTPTWSTSAGSLGTVYETASISNTLSATSDSPVTYSVDSGILPTGVTLNATSGLLSGVAGVVSGSTTYNFVVDAKDGEGQDTNRNFSYTLNPDAVTWASPAAGATLTGSIGTAYTQALSATSAAGKAITYTANALPAGLSISGSSITGTPSDMYSNSSLLTATAAITGRIATRTFKWSITQAPPTTIGQAFGGGYYAGKISTTGNGVATHYLVVAPKATGEINSSPYTTWKTTNTSTAGTTSTIDGPTNSANMNDASHPAAWFCEGLTIGGFSDWYMPSKWEMDVIYYFLKPTTQQNGAVADATTTPGGGNPYAVSPQSAALYTTTSPAQTSVAVFKTGNSEALALFWYLSSTELSATTASAQSFSTGQFTPLSKTGTTGVRAVRRIPI